MKNAPPIAFVDSDSHDEANIFVRYDESTVGLAISLKSNGDIEAFMTKETARMVIAALQEAVGEPMISD
jgi:hypothetical protein